METRTPRIQSFPQDGGVWRLDWFGAIKHTPYDSIEPVLEVAFSPCKSMGKVYVEQQLFCEVGIGLLPYLRIGSYWQNGYALPKQSAGHYQRLKHIHISRDTVRYFVAAETEPHKINRYLIPPFAYQLCDRDKAGASRRHLQSSILTIPYKNDPRGIILPALEALRFYYTGSTNLTSLAISGAYTQFTSDIINPEKSGYYKQKNRCVLQLRRWIEDQDGWIIGRVLFDPIARNGAEAIHKSILRMHSSGKAVHPSCELPFAGFTDWGARGIWFKSDGKDRFLILELCSCSAPFPFSELHVIRDNDGRQAEKETDIPDEEKQPCWAIPPKKQNQGERNAAIQHEQDPQRHVETYKIQQIDARFDFLADKEIKKTDKIANYYKSASLAPLPSVIVDSLSSGPGIDRGQLIASVQVNSGTRKKGIGPSYEDMVAACGILNSQEGTSAHMRSRSYGEFQLPLLSPRKRWPFLCIKTRQPRCVWAIDICHNNQWYCFLDFELRYKGEKATGLISFQDGHRATDFEFQRIKNQISATEGMWRERDWFGLGLMVTSRRRTWAGAREMATAIMKIISTRQV
jgi:hypothetical protein